MLADELSKREYATQESLLRRAVQAVLDWVAGLFEGAAGDAVSIWWYALAGAGLLVVLALIAWGLVRLQPGRRVRTTRDGSVFDEAGVAATDYLARARRARDAGDFAAAVVDGYRAVVAGAIERFVIDDRPGMTAREIAQALTGPFPDSDEDLHAAAGAFGAVRYGGLGADAAEADRMLTLEEHLRHTTPHSLELT